MVLDLLTLAMTQRIILLLKVSAWLESIMAIGFLEEDGTVNASMAFARRVGNIRSSW